MPRRASAARYSGLLRDRAHRLRGFVHEQRGPHALDSRHSTIIAGADVDDGLDDTALRTGHDDGAHSALDRVAGLPLREHVLVGSCKHDVREERAVGERGRCPA